MAGVGRIGIKVRKFVRDLPDLTGLAEITAEMAIVTADLADRTRRDGKPRETLAALKDLRELLSQLPGQGATGDGRGSTGGAPVGQPGPTDELESLLGAGPTLGD